ncbi:MAG: carboxypeptidase regulatory-like domain-containing protein [Candidatus Koribacter versatilis]|uniref:Carboxypeptidase regulatory-like domain-containing protein n=1 Tax=Candidatus Korobacter versatilis TaxID=658062 RepID=A0A932A8U7_9BACT|nr:carboxypeptidase regulatory-like domain-containing protein [Candidatus Koribacter versatilis]
MKRIILAVALLLAPLAAQDTATLDGEPAIRFMAGHGHLTTYCDGQIWITPTRLRFDGVTFPAHSFDFKRAEVGAFHSGHALGFDYIKVEGGGKTFRMGLYPDMARQFGDRYAFAERAWNDFQPAYAEVTRAEAQRHPPAGLIKASATGEGAVLEFPVIIGPGAVWFKSAKKVTLWEGAEADGSAYASMIGKVARGKLQVTAGHVKFVSAQAAGDPDLVLDSGKSEMRMNTGAGGYPRIIASFRSAGRMTLLLAEAGDGGTKFYDVTPLLRALGPEFPQMAAELLPKPVLVVAASPGAEIFVDGQRRGVTAADGTLRVTGLAGGEHPLRATLAGYQPWSSAVTLASGEEKRVEVALVAVPPPVVAPKPAGPAAFALKDVVAMLAGGISPKRVAALVQERGVDFPLDDAAEKQVRGAGGDAELLVVIAKSKK